MNDSEQIQAPFTPEQVKHLNQYQVSGAMHEFTCGNSKHPKRGKRSRLKMLVAAPDGWFCPGCGKFVQFWAWATMADGSWIKSIINFKNKPFLDRNLYTEEGYIGEEFFSTPEKEHLHKLMIVEQSINEEVFTLKEALEIYQVSLEDYEKYLIEKQK